MSETHFVFSLLFKAHLRMALLNGFCGGFLHNEPLPSFIDSLLSVFSPSFDFCSLFFWVLILFLLSAGFPSLLRHQTWALLRSVERALGSINRITGVARAGVYGVCLHQPGPGEGWATLCWDLLLRSALLPSLLHLFPPSACPTRLSWPLSFLQPRPAHLSLGSHYLIFTSCLGVLPVFVWMMRMCW